MDLEQRNRLRAEANLPLLDVAVEKSRLQKMKDKAEFEREWDRRRAEFAHWVSTGEGWIARMGRWSISRQRVRQEMREARGSPPGSDQ